MRSKLKLLGLFHMLLIVMHRGVLHAACVQLHTLKQLHYESKTKVKCRRESQALADLKRKYDGECARNFTKLNKRK